MAKRLKEPPQSDGSNEYPQSIFKSNKNVYPCKPQFYYIKVGCKGLYITRTCLHDELHVQLSGTFTLQCL